MMSRRILAIFAAFDRGEFGLPELLEKLDQHAEACSRERRVSRKPTQQGLAPVVLVEP